MFWRRKSKARLKEENPGIEEVKQLEQKINELRKQREQLERQKTEELKRLEQKKKELEQLIEKRKKEIDTLKEQVRIGKRVVVLIRQGPAYVKVRGKITVAGIVFRYMGKKWEVPFNDNHFFWMKHGGWFSRPQLTVYVDLDKMYTVPPPDVKVSVEREMDSRAVQAVLTIYRSILFGQRREQMAILVGMVIALAGLAVAAMVIWQYNQSLQHALEQLHNVLQQLNEILKQYPPAPQPAPPAGG